MLTIWVPYYYSVDMTEQFSNFVQIKIINEMSFSLFITKIQSTSHYEVVPASLSSLLHTRDNLETSDYEVLHMKS